jgi:hypothetical protein
MWSPRREERSYLGTKSGQEHPYDRKTGEPSSYILPEPDVIRQKRCQREDLTTTFFGFKGDHTILARFSYSPVTSPDPLTVVTSAFVVF